jgi:succinate dehydrogenase/fumarate reductase flavoprotein subunit/maleate cis-trans isomerase
MPPAKTRSHHIESLVDPQPSVEEFDVVVVGYGAAGGVAALTAKEHGASVVILEKMPLPGGNSRASAANQTYPKRVEDRDLFVDYLYKVSNNTVSRKMVEVFVDGLLQNPEWYKKHGGELTKYVFEPSYSLFIPDKTYPALLPELEMEIRTLKQTPENPEPTGGHRVWAMIDRNVRAFNIPVKLEADVKKILTKDGEVTGVLAEIDGKTITFKARKGVVLTCGGFEFNDELKHDYLAPSGIQGYGNPGNTGDGIKMVQEIGADLWHMTRFAGGINIKVPEFESAFYMNLKAPGFIYVDQEGERWADETRLECHEAWAPLSQFSSTLYKYDKVPSFLIMDEELIQKGPIISSLMGYNVVQLGYKWSADNSVEIQKGWIKKADTIEELAAQLGVSPFALDRTISEYNKFCSAKYDEKYHRRGESLKELRAPFYSATLSPCMFNTQGGAKRNEHAEVLDVRGKPIPRLYSAGEFGSMWGFLYQTSTNYSECIVFGRVAGENVVKLKPLDPKRHEPAGPQEYVNFPRFGLLTPATNVTVELDFKKMNIPNVAHLISRINITQPDWKDDKQQEEFVLGVQRSTDDAISYAIQCKPQAIMLGISVAAFWGGPKFVQDWKESVMRKWKVPFYTPYESVAEALKVYNIKTVCVVQPYQPIADAKIVEYFKAHGITVLGQYSFRVTNAVHVVDISQHDLFQESVNLKAKYPSVQAICHLGGSDVAFATVVEPLEKELGIPVIACNTALAWYALRSEGIKTQIEGWGDLFRSH